MDSFRRMAGEKFKHTITFELKSDNSVKIINSSIEDLDKSLPLYWTMIYDEGFEVQLHNLKFFHFNHYEKTGMRVKIWVKEYCGVYINYFQFQFQIIKL